ERLESFREEIDQPPCFFGPSNIFVGDAQSRRNSGMANRYGACENRPNFFGQLILGQADSCGSLRYPYRELSYLVYVQPGLYAGGNGDLERFCQVFEGSSRLQSVNAQFAKLLAGYLLGRDELFLILEHLPRGRCKL